jgi:hypothetical protein
MLRKWLLLTTCLLVLQHLGMRVHGHNHEIQQKDRQRQSDLHYECGHSHGGVHMTRVHVNQHLDSKQALVNLVRQPGLGVGMVVEMTSLICEFVYL